MPGVTLNLSKKGVSTSIGPRGAKITLGHGQTRVTTGLPGSGLSHTTITKHASSKTKLIEESPTPARPPKPTAYSLGNSLGKLIFTNKKRLIFGVLILFGIVAFFNIYT